MKKMRVLDCGAAQTGVQMKKMRVLDCGAAQTGVQMKKMRVLDCGAAQTGVQMKKMRVLDCGAAQTGVQMKKMRVLDCGAAQTGVQMKKMRVLDCGAAYSGVKKEGKRINSSSVAFYEPLLAITYLTIRIGQPRRAFGMGRLTGGVRPLSGYHGNRKALRNGGQLYSQTRTWRTVLVRLLDVSLKLRVVNSWENLGASVVDDEL
ncbi:hypothetical protein BaRGS_00006260 [Batillaria attramentaria]|uniref:Uncharacterized protein n=1 Tax=Batillaria attramentaria TaxID=370345 RepID=A0ABD0LS90_9CAEN